MSDTTTPKPAELSGLRIHREQRPTAGGRTWLLLAALLVVVGGGAIAAGWWYYRTTGVNIVAALSTRPVDVNLVIVPVADERAEPVVLVATGKIVSDVRVNVSTKVSGQITELFVEQGDSVQKGQVLARIEDVIYRAQRDEAAANVAERRHAIERARAESARAQAAIVQARAELAFRKRDHDRLEALFRKGQASELEYLNAKNLYEAAAAAVDVAVAAARSAETAIAVAQSELAAAESILRVWEKRLADCAIVAPISGVVLERNAQVGDFLAAEGGRGANANAQLVSIADMTLLRVEIDVSERDVHRVRAGQRARVTPDAVQGATYDGQVMWVDPLGDYARATVQVKVRIQNPGPDLRVEGSAKVEFLGPAAGSAPATGAATLWLPKAAVKLTPGSDEARVFTVSGDRAVAHAIRIGARTEKMVEVRSGVQPGMQIVCENLDNVEDGSPVRVVHTVRLGDL